jgi:hypothetical protein
MAKFNGSETVKAGFYFDTQAWHVTTMSGKGGTLPGGPDTTYVRVPLPLLLVGAPMMGAAFAMFLPFIGIAMVVDHVTRKAWGAAKDAVHGSMEALSHRTATGEAYFTGSADEKTAQAPDAAAGETLKKIETAIEAKEQGEARK